MPDVYGGKWKIVESLSEGGQAHTFIVRKVQEDGDETYVLKRLKDPARIGRFRNEVEAGLKLKHNNIVEVIDWDLDGRQPYIVTVYCKGGSLNRARPFDYSDHGRLLDLFGQICDGVLHAHSQRVIHRDLKPDNIFLWADRHGDAVVGDFGLCFLEEGERITLTEEAVGARNYTAPELEDGRAEQVSAQSDVYSLGKILYWLVSAGRTFSREKHRDPEFDLVRLTNNLYLEHVNRLLDQMVVLDAGKRWHLEVVRNQVAISKRLIVGEYNPVGPSVWARCYYCGMGSYLLIGRDRETTENEYFIRTGQPGDWRVLVCNYCGHVQTFRPDIGRRISDTHSTPWDPPAEG
ncbi:MAG: serine/threonine protein kinase [Chloroflexi bacterium]|nr:serine/threonine protein kinase [Chloroflexota bacterium]